MILYIVRHAWADHHGAAEWADDDQRPLTAEGRERFARVAKTLVARGVSPSIVATSPLVRCRQTAELLAAAVGSEPPVVELDALRPHGELATLVAWTAEQAKAHDQIAWVGHAPDVGRMVAALIGQGAWIRLSKGAAAAIEFDEEPAPGSGELQWLVTAKMLGC